MSREETKKRRKTRRDFLLQHFFEDGLDEYTARYIGAFVLVKYKDNNYDFWNVAIYRRKDYPGLHISRS